MGWRNKQRKTEVNSLVNDIMAFSRAVQNFDGHVSESDTIAQLDAQIGYKFDNLYY